MKLAGRFFFSGTYSGLYIDPRRIGLYSENLARALNWPFRHGSFRPVQSSVTSREPTDLLPVQVDAVGVSVATGRAEAGIFTEHRAVRVFCLNTYRTLQSPWLLRFVFGHQQTAEPEIAPPVWTHIRIERSDVSADDPCYVCNYYLPPATGPGSPYEISGYATRPGVKAFRMLTEVLPARENSPPSYIVFLSSHPPCSLYSFALSTGN